MNNWPNAALPERLPPFSKKRLPKKVILSYILDYVIIVALILGFTILDKVEPYHQPWSMKNYTLHYPYAVHERIPVFQLCLIVILAPAIIIAFYTLVIDGIFSHQPPASHGGRGRKLLGRYRLKDRLWELNCGILGLMLSVCAAFTITGALKNAIGKPRPDLVDRCKVREGYEEGATGSFPLTTHAVCTQTDNAILKDGFRSFPSGHSSTAFAGLYYLSLYLAAKLHVMDSKGEVWKTFIVLIPTLAAALVAGSRIMDARHHPFDVLSGSLLGILVAWASYRQYFPPITEPWKKGRAHPIRSWGRSSLPPPTFHIEEDTEPLRSMGKSGDLESGTATGFSAASAPSPAGAAPGENVNVFRQQIHDSQRRRQQDTGYSGQGATPFGVHRNDTTESADSTNSARTPIFQAAPIGSKPFMRVPPRQDDDYGFSSSDEDNTPGYELEETYAPGVRPGNAYDPVSRTYPDTGYHPATVGSLSPADLANIAPGSRSPHPPAASGDLADSKRESPMAPAVPPHAPGTTL